MLPELNQLIIRFVAVVFMLSAFLCSTSKNCLAREFFVAQNGEDSNSGDKTHPFRTFKKAQSAVRTFKKSSSKAESVTVWFNAGRYSVSETIRLTSLDSGTEKFPVTYRAIAGEKVSFTGGEQLPGDRFELLKSSEILGRIPPEARKHVRQFDLGAYGIESFGNPLPDRFQGYAGWPELFCNDVPMTLSRWPNKGFAKVRKVVRQGSVPRKGDKSNLGGAFQYQGNRPERWLSAETVHLKGYWCFKWASETLRVAKIDPAQKTISFLRPHTYGIGGRSGGDFIAINLLEELDQPGEYFIDRKNKMLYFWPPVALSKASIQISLLNDPMFILDRVSHLVFQGFTFENSRRKIFEIKNDSSHNLITSCTIRNIAQGAVSIIGGTNNGISRCTLYQLGGSGISLTGGDRATLTPCHHFVEDCHIHHFGRLFRTYRVAIQLGGVGCRVSNNLIHDAPHIAISFSGNEHLIESNEIHHVCSETDDAAAIYTGRDWTTYGTVIKHNYIHHIGGDTHVGNQAIYVDDVGGGITCQGNIIEQVYRGFLIGGGRDNIMQNNILINCKIPFHIDNRGLTWAGEGTENWRTTTKRLEAIPYRKEPWKSRYPQLINFFKEKPGAPIRCEIRKNLLLRCGKWNVNQVAKENGTIQNNFESSSEILEGKKIFRNYQKQDYSIEADSSVFKKILGFESIPFDEIGPQKDRKGHGKTSKRLNQKTLPVSQQKVEQPRWIKVTDSAAWQPRDSQGEVVFKDKMWILGGWFNSYEAPPRDVWSSADGKSWEKVSANAPWKHSDLPMSLAFKNKMWIMGGWYNGRLPGHSASNQVWASGDGIKWNLVTKSAPWSARLASAIVEFKGKMWLLGGSENYYFGDQKSLKNDVWFSEDGVKWTEATADAGWAPRAYHQAAVLNGRIYVFGGGNYVPKYEAHCDVWSSADGVSWRKETAKAPWNSRLWFSGVTYRDHLWVLGGWSNNPSQNWGDVWYSKDGKNWYELRVSQEVSWKERHEHSVFVFQDQLWIAGGHARPLSNEVWKLQLPKDWPAESK